MKKISYLQDSLSNGRIIRWQMSQMPLPVYIAPFRWYKRSKNDALKYKDMVMQALNIWQSITKNLVSFVIVPSLNDSAINLDWRRVDRKSFGDCSYNYTKEGIMYSAEIQIGLSDGIISQQYMDENEVMHTIIHEIGHAIGIAGHSPFREDIMYTPHQYGVVRISERDVRTVNWLYRFPVGANYGEILSKYPQAGVQDLDSLIYVLTHSQSDFEKIKNGMEQHENKRDIFQETNNIAELKKYMLVLNKMQIRIKED